MRTQTYKFLSNACLVAGHMSIAGSLVLWLTGRVRQNRAMQRDGQYVGLWVPSFFILSDRLATASLDHQEKRRSTHAGHEVADTCEAIDAERQSERVQSPRPMQHVSPHETAHRAGV